MNQKVRKNFGEETGSENWIRKLKNFWSQKSESENFQKIESEKFSKQYKHWYLENDVIEK